jgi:hypothetical protein
MSNLQFLKITPNMSVFGVEILSLLKPSKYVHLKTKQLLPFYITTDGR